MNREGSSIQVVGIGASAGGLDALKDFFVAMPADNGMAFVVIQHLDPAHVSYMAGLLAKHTTMAVSPAEDGVEVRANSVYTIPPNTSLFIKEGNLHLTDPIKRDGIRMPIDFFFRSLAQDQHEKAMCVLLSGSGSDGTLGIREIHGAGGIVVVQDPRPLSSILCFRARSQRAWWIPCCRRHKYPPRFLITRAIRTVKARPVLLRRPWKRLSNRSLASWRARAKIAFRPIENPRCGAAYNAAWGYNRYYRHCRLCAVTP